MNRKSVIVGALAIMGALGAGAAQARDSQVQWSLSIGVPFAAPVYTQPYPVYTQPYPVYVEPAPIVQYRPYGYSYGSGQGQRQYREPTRWDRDGDGIANRYDRVYNPRWDRDGDGVPNRYDRHDRYDGYRGDGHRSGR